MVPFLVCAWFDFWKLLFMTYDWIPVAGVEG